MLLLWRGIQGSDVKQLMTAFKMFESSDPWEKNFEKWTSLLQSQE